MSVDFKAGYLAEIGERAHRRSPRLRRAARDCWIASGFAPKV